jgi:hypothetical protein
MVVLVVNTFVGDSGGPVGPSSLLASATMAWDSVDVCVYGLSRVCQWLGWWPRRRCDPCLFLGGISWVFCQASKHIGRQCWDLLAEG